MGWTRSVTLSAGTPKHPQTQSCPVRKGPLGIIPSDPRPGRTTWSRWYRNGSRWAWNVSGETPRSPWAAVQCPAILSVKFYMLRWNSSGFSLYPPLRVLSLGTGSLALSPWHLPWRYLHVLMRSLLNFSFLQRPKAGQTRRSSRMSPPKGWRLPSAAGALQHCQEDREELEPRGSARVVCGMARPCAAVGTPSDPASPSLLSPARPSPPPAIPSGRRSALDCGDCSRGGAARRWIGGGCATGARWRRRWAGGWTSAWRRCGSTTPTSAASWTWPARWRSTPSATAPASGYVRARPARCGTPRPPPRCEGGGAGGACWCLLPVSPVCARQPARARRGAPGCPGMQLWEAAGWRSSATCSGGGWSLT